MAERDSSSFQVPGHQIVRILGTGAHSTLWEVREKNTGRRHAVKRVVKEGKDDEKFFTQIRNEYEVSVRIDHPSVRKVHKLIKVRKLMQLREILLLMEYCPGRSVQEHRPGTLREVCDIFAQVAYGMHQINEAGFVHADMKPNNIIVDEKGGVKIIDLGHTCPVGTTKERIQGTPDYIAPEQIFRWPLDARTDVFNFGASIYWALTGKALPTLLPKRGTTTIDSMPQSPMEANPIVPQDLSDLTMECARLQPTERPASMLDVAKRLGVILRSLASNGKSAG